MTKKLSVVKENEKGFTLVELMIVVAIIGILAAVAIPQYQNFTKKSKSSEAKVILDAIITAEAAYYAEQDSFTENLSDLGNPESPAKYYDYSLDVEADNNVTATATPNDTGTNAGLESDWVITYDVNGTKTTSFPGKGW